MNDTPLRPDGDTSAAAALDAALDALVAGLPTPPDLPDLPLAADAGLSADSSIAQDAVPASDYSASFDPVILQTAARLQTAHGATEPSPAFATSLRRALLAPSATPEATPAPPRSIPVQLGSGAVVLPHSPGRGRWTSRIWPATELAAIVLLFAVLLGTLSGGDTFLPRLLDLTGLRQDPPAGPPRSTAPMLGALNTTVFPPASTPAGERTDVRCTVPPADLSSLVATVYAINARSPDTPAPTPTPFPAHMGQPADSEISTAVQATVVEWVACTNAGEEDRVSALFTPDFFARSLGPRISSDPNPDPVPDPEPATPRPSSERLTIRSLGNVRILPDGRAVIDLHLTVQGEPADRVYSFQYVLADRGDRWLIDHLALYEGDGGTPGATPETGRSSSSSAPQPIFPVGATISVQATTVVLYALPRSDAEPIARLGPCACTMTVFAPMADSGDALWLGVTDNQTGVSGYVSLDAVEGPDLLAYTGIPDGTTYVTTSPLRLRLDPTPLSIAESPLPAGTTITVTGNASINGLIWYAVIGSLSGNERWILPDLLATTTTVSPATPSSAMPTPALAPTTGAIITRNDADYAVEELVAVATEGVNFRSALAFDEDNVIEQLQEGEQLLVTGSAVFENDGTWWPVEQRSTGLTGFVVAEFLRADGPTVPTPDPSPACPQPTASTGAVSGNASRSSCAP